MKEIFPIEFEYHHHKYFGIVRVRQKENATELKVRIMNARIDRLFYGHHTFYVKNNQVIAEEEADHGKAAMLRNLIQHSIEQYLNVSPPRRA